MLTNISLWLWNLCLPSDSLLFKLYRNYLTSRPVGCLILHGPEVHDTSGPSHQDSGQLDTGLMKESSGMMIVDIRRPSQCDRAPDSWQLTVDRAQASTRWVSTQHQSTSRCWHRSWTLSMWTLSPSPPRLAQQTPGHSGRWSPDPDSHPSYRIQCSGAANSVLQFLDFHHFTQFSYSLKLGSAKIFFSRFLMDIC